MWKSCDSQTVLYTQRVLTFTTWLPSSGLITEDTVLSKWLCKTIRETQELNSFICTMLWPPHVKSWLIGKDPDAGRDWEQEEKGMTEDEMAGWHHWLDGRESEWTPGVGDGQGGLACCDSWGRKESDMTERLNWTDGRQLPYFGSGTMKRKSRPHCHWGLMLWFSVALDSWVASHQPRPR